MVAAQSLGIARAALEYMTAYANRREAFGAPIIDNQGIAFPWPTWRPVSTPPGC